ncbi:hypothetical protein LY78DRAFT_594152, partial [Colletotrichum sublineola]
SNESEYNMPSTKSDFVVLPRVIAVREDQGRPPEIIPRQFELRIRHSQQGLVLFSLTVSFTASASTKTTIYLQITADTLHSLERMDYNESDNNNRNPHYLEKVYHLLEDMRSVTRLQFRLRNSEHIQLAVPFDFDLDNILDDTARSTFESAELLAAASTFSLYFQHNVLKKASFLKYSEAVLPLGSVTEALRKSYKGMGNVKRLYNGRGGKVHIPRHHHPHDPPPPAGECCSSPVPATTASCGSTLPFETVPRLQESPPPYDECLGEGQSPSAKSDAATTPTFTKSRPGDARSPPRYENTKRNPSHGVSPCGNQDTDKHPTPKRKRSFAAVCSPMTTAIVSASRVGKIPRSPFLDSDDEDNAARFLHSLELQRQQIELQRQQIELQREQIEHLRKSVKELQRWKNEHEGRHDDLEADCLNLENRQDQTDDAIDNLSIDISELEDKYAEVAHQIPDVCDEFNDMKENIGDTLKQDMRKLVEDSMTKQIVECVEAQADEMKRRIRQALH